MTVTFKKECFEVVEDIKNLKYPLIGNWTWDSADSTSFISGYEVRNTKKSLNLPRLTLKLASGRNFFTTCGNIKYTVNNPD